MVEITETPYRNVRSKKNIHQDFNILSLQHPLSSFTGNALLLVCMLLAALALAAPECAAEQSVEGAAVETPPPAEMSLRAASANTVIQQDYVDPLFAPEVTGSLKAAAQQPDGKILLGGKFTHVNGVPSNDLARVNPDGTLDATFQFVSELTWPGQGPTAGYILAILVLPDGKILIGGEFDHVGSFETYTLARLNSDGSVDPTFRANKAEILKLEQSWHLANGLELRADGSILAVELEGLSLRGDPLAFDADGTPSSVPPDYYFFPRQSTGKRVGFFAGAINDTRSYFYRSNTDGTPDPSFYAPPEYKPYGFSYVFEILPNDMIVFQGTQSTADGLLNGIFRLLPDGPVDPTFRHSVNGGAELFPLQDSSIILIGNFSAVNGIPRQGVARLLAGPVGPPYIISGPSHLLSTAGRNVRFEVTAASHNTPSYQWKFQGQNIPGATNRVLEIANVQTQQAGEYQVQVRNTLGATLSSPARLSLTATLPGAVDPSFGTVADIDGAVYALAKDANGRWIIGGNFEHIDGVTRRGAARLLANGALDAAFGSASEISGTTNTHVATLAVQNDGRILIGGQFTHVNQTPRPGLARLNADGTLDPTFAAVPDAALNVDVVKSDHSGRILVGGDFRYKANQPWFDHLVRLNMDGSLDENFKPWITGVICGHFGCSDLATIRDIVLRRDGKVLFAGAFRSSFSAFTKSVMRVDASGAHDPAFEANLADITSIATSGDAIPRLTAMAQQPDGKVIIAGRFTFRQSNGSIEPIQRNLARLNADGSRDSSFSLDLTFEGTIRAIAVDPEGRILVGGAFQWIHGVQCMNIARLTSRGQLDTSFNPGSGANGAVHEIIPLENGSIMIAGAFTEVDGVKRPGVARLFGEDHSRPRIRLSIAKNGSPVLRWQTVAGKRYLLESTDSFSPSTQWTRICEADGDGESKEFVDASNSGRHRYFRLRLE